MGLQLKCSNTNINYVPRHFYARFRVLFTILRREPSAVVADTQNNHCVVVCLRYPMTKISHQFLAQ